MYQDSRVKPASPGHGATLASAFSQITAAILVGAVNTPFPQAHACPTYL